jgi:flagellar protein FlaG
MDSIITQNTDNLIPIKQGNSAASQLINKSLDEASIAAIDSEKTVESVNKSAEEKTVEQGQEALTKAIEVVSDFMNRPPRNVNFSQAENSGKTIVKIFDAESQELIKQFPSEKIINMAERINSLHQEIEKAPGLLIDSHI